MDVATFVLQAALTPGQVAERTRQIHTAALARSKYLAQPNFAQIHTSDLELLFNEYDRAFFSGQVRPLLAGAPLAFGLSQRMTSAGGKTTRYVSRANGSRRFEISVSTAILFGCFRDDDHRPIVCSGIVCRDRLDALQRVLEHELTHLLEMLLWERSSCAQHRFHSITRRFFGHTENKHQLITPRERARVQFGVRPGIKVKFRFDGCEYTGIVNRVSKRATVLVEDSRGLRYSNGKHYAKFYVPVQQLEAME